MSELKVSVLFLITLNEIVHVELPLERCEQFHFKVLIHKLVNEQFFAFNNYFFTEFVPANDVVCSSFVDKVVQL